MRQFLLLLIHTVIYINNYGKCNARIFVGSWASRSYRFVRIGSMSKYVFKPYNSIFPELFEKEKERLSKYLTGEYQIEHVGSTAVQGLGGKGIIDIYLATPRKNL